MTEMKTLPMRLAMRVEGPWWVAYLASASTMEGAREMGRILTDIVQNSDDRLDEFKKLMQECMADAVERVTGERPVMVAGPAPESERAGRA